LYKTVSAVEHAALRPARTVKFEIELLEVRTGKQISQMKLGKELYLMVQTVSYEEDVENLNTFVTFPSEIKITELEPSEKEPGFDITIFKDYTVVYGETAFLPKGIADTIYLHVTPKKVGEFPISFQICGKGIYDYKTKLILRVVK